MSTVAVDGGGIEEIVLVFDSSCSCPDCSGDVGRGVLIRRGKNMDVREKRLVEDREGTVLLLLLTLFRFIKARSLSLRREVVGCRLAEAPAVALSMVGDVRRGREGRKNGGRRKE